MLDAISKTVAGEEQVRTRVLGCRCKNIYLASTRPWVPSSALVKKKKALEGRREPGEKPKGKRISALMMDAEYKHPIQRMWAQPSLKWLPSRWCVPGNNQIGPLCLAASANLDVPP